MTDEETAADRARKDAEEMKGNIDKVLQHLGRLDAICARLDALEGGGKGGPGNGLEIDHGRGTRVDPVKEREEFAQMADAQARADSVYQALGQRAPMPMSGENLANYRVRLGRGLQLHSKQFAKVDLHAVRADAEAFNAIEGVIYADALVSARNPQVAEGHIQKRERTLESGHKCVEFFGSTTIFKAFAPPAMRATKFLVPNHSSH